MSKINILDEKIYNRIAAGEVVESPASIVKELIENSIDANATDIVIDIKNGGIDSIVVSDNGDGIEKDDIEKAFLSHATSKVSSLKCLESISSLGFRGEALPSIASVALVKMVSKTKNQQLANGVIYSFGKKIRTFQEALAKGTTVEVSELFKQIPARKKFLSSALVEENKITRLIKRLILANPDIAIKYVVNSNVKYQSCGSGQKQAAFSVFGPELENMVFVSEEGSTVSVDGFVSLPLFTRHNKQDQIIIVNKRAIENHELSFMVNLAYSGVLLPKRYPVFFLNITVPFDLVDVNVHPNKLEVKFVELTKIKKKILGLVKNQVQGSTGLYPSYVSSREPATISISEPIPISTNKSATYKGYSIGGFQPTKQGCGFVSDSAAFSYTNTRESIKGNIEEVFSEKTEYKEKTQEEFFVERPVVKDTLFNTFLVLECSDSVYFIDQHAAHERLLYDRFLCQQEKAEIPMQPLLVPYEFLLDALEAEKLLETIPDLLKAGFLIENIEEHKYKISAVPMILSDIDIFKFISSLLKDDIESLIKEKLARSACKAAIKGGEKLSRQDAEKLVELVNKEISVPLCPHGRPILIKITKNQIEDWFRR